MPPKRALAEASTSAQAASPKAKKSRKPAAQDIGSQASGESAEEWLTEESSDSDNTPTDVDFSDEVPTDVAGPKPQPFDYYSLPRPFFDVVAENDGKEEDAQADEDELEEKYDEDLEKLAGKRPKPAVECPENRWIAMWETWTIFTDWQRKGTYRCPDLFDMYIYNDFYSYGLQELVENLLIAFDTLFQKKDRDETTLKHMWANAAATVHWLSSEDDSEPWSMMDDGARYEATRLLVARMFLATLHELDRGDLLRSDSPIKDLPLVMSLYVRWGDELEMEELDTEELETPNSEADLVYVSKHVLSYARKAGINLEEPSGCYGTKQTIEFIENEFGAVGPIRASTADDKWDWKKAFDAYKTGYKIVGGEQYNILFFSRAKRAKYSRNKKDPLSNVPEKDLKREMIHLG